MSIAIEKQANASERFLLVRLNPGRFLMPTFDLTYYIADMPFIPSKVELNGVLLTEDEANPSVNGHWYYDRDALEIRLKLASAPDDTDNILICYYYLFYTGTIYRDIGEDPSVPSNKIRSWEPRLSNYPSFTQSFEDILAGVFSISDTTVKIINTDSVFQQYLTDEDSFYNKQVDIWICINSVDNIQKVFTGTIQSLSIDTQSISLRCLDSFNSFVRPALMGDSTEECFFRRSASGFPSLDPNFHDTVLPYIVGSSSRYKTEAFASTEPGVPDLFRVSVGTPAPCTSYSASLSTSVNRTFGACRMKGSPRAQAYGSIANSILTLDGYSVALINDMSNVEVGDTFKWTETSTTYHSIVNYVGDFDFFGFDMNIIFSGPSTPFNVVSTLHPLQSFCVFIQLPEGTFIYPRIDRDYTINETATSGGNNYIEIEFVNDFETNFSEFGGEPLDPNAHLVFFRATNDVVQTHADILKEMTEKAGLTANTASFTAAATELPVNARFHIPNFDELDYKSYLETAQDVLRSSLGYLKVNTSFEVEYHILAAPSSSSVRDVSLTLDGGTSCELEYADIVTSIIAYNPHHESQQAIDGASSPSETRQNQKAAKLQGVVNVNRFRHVLEEITSNIDRHMAINSSRRATYSLRTATEDIDSELGQDIELANSIALGGSGSVDLKIISVEKSPESISIRASDLKGL